MTIPTDGGSTSAAFRYHGSPSLYQLETLINHSELDDENEQWKQRKVETEAQVVKRLKATTDEEGAPLADMSTWEGTDPAAPTQRHQPQDNPARRTPTNDRPRTTSPPASVNDPEEECSLSVSSLEWAIRI